MKIALLQDTIIWENVSENLKKWTLIIDTIVEGVELIILPEMFTTGFTMKPNLVAETMAGATIQWLKATAKSKNTAITGSIVITEDNNFYNRLLFCFPDGTIQYYDKRHLFTLTGEEKVYKPNASQKLIVEYKNWKIATQICYDLRFPVYSRNVEDYDLLLYVANWPDKRINAWDILLKARAVENMSYVVGVNRVGDDGNNINYSGHSQVVDELGNYLIAPFNDAKVVYATLDKNKLLATRKKLNFLNDRDHFILKFQ